MDYGPSGSLIGNAYFTMTLRGAACWMWWTVRGQCEASVETRARAHGTLLIPI